MTDINKFSVYELRAMVATEYPDHKDTCWAKELSEAMSDDEYHYGAESTGEVLIETPLTSKELIKPFDGGFGSPEGIPLVAWGAKYVYFPIVYDGAESIGCAPRNPPHAPLEHQGGG
jgi:hypothetical protein